MEPGQAGSGTVEVLDGVTLSDDVQRTVRADAERLVVLAVEEVRRVPVVARGYMEGVGAEYGLYDPVWGCDEPAAEEAPGGQYEVVGLEGDVAVVGREEALHALLMDFGPENRVAQEILASQCPEAALQELLGLDSRDRGRQGCQQVERHLDHAFQRLERVVAVDADDGGQDGGVAAGGCFADGGGQRLEILVVVEDAGDVRRSHFAGVAADLLEGGAVDRPEAAGYAVFAELLGDELRVEVQETLDIDDADRLEGQFPRLCGREVSVDGQPRGDGFAHGGDAEVVLAALSRDGDAGFTQQSGHLTGVSFARLGADDGIGVPGFGRLERGDTRQGVRYGSPVRHPSEQVERSR